MFFIKNWLIKRKLQKKKKLPKKCCFFYYVHATTKIEMINGQLYNVSTNPKIFEMKKYFSQCLTLFVLAKICMYWATVLHKM